MGRKQFYTQRDIEDLVAQGTTILTLNDDIVLTDLARERAAELGLTLTADQKNQPPQVKLPGLPGSTNPDELTAKVKATVLARMGPGISETLLDAIIPRILAEVQAKQGSGR
jgi:hypothetical protein